MKIELTARNIFGKEIKKGSINIKGDEVIFPSNRVFKLKKQPLLSDMFYEEREGEIIIRGGKDGFISFMKEINVKDSPYNPCYTLKFIEM